MIQITDFFPINVYIILKLAIEGIWKRAFENIKQAQWVHLYRSSHFLHHQSFEF